MSWNNTVFSSRRVASGEKKLVQRYVVPAFDAAAYQVDVQRATAPDGRPTQHTFCWVDRYQLPQFWLYPIVSAVIGEIILQSTVPAAKSLIILPGGRANLVSYKLRRDPRLARLCDASQGGWRFIKFRHLRWLEGNPLLSRENFDEQLTLDPLTYTTPQLRLL